MYLCDTITYRLTETALDKGLFDMLTKANQRQIQILMQHYTAGNDGAVARGLSYMIRAALRHSEQLELRKVAEQLNVSKHPEFIC